jgi:hypothetical protein
MERIEITEKRNGIEKQNRFKNGWRRKGITKKV